MLVGFLEICNKFGYGNSLEVLFLWEDTSAECTEGTVHVVFVSQHAFFVLSRVQMEFSMCVLGNNLERATKGISLCFKTVF